MSKSKDKQMTCVMLDQRIMEMLYEVRNHPDLRARMSEAELQGAKAHATIFTMQQDDNIPLIQSFEQGIGFLAAEVGILLAGDYSYSDICDICDQIRLRLIDKRTVIINSVDTVEIAIKDIPAVITPRYMH